MAVTSEMAERDERVGGYLQKDKITPEILKLFEGTPLQDYNPTKTDSDEQIHYEKSDAGFREAPWSQD